MVLADTWADAADDQETFGLSRRRVAVIPVGALPEPRADGGARETGRGGPLTVLQYGKWSPLHGTDIVLGAAELLRAEPFRFVLIGEGQLSAELRATIAARGLTNVEWLGQLPAQELRSHTLAADVCLGVFGGSEKARRVVPNKVYDALACGRPGRHRGQRRRARVAARRRDRAAHACRRRGRAGGRPPPAARRA